MKKIILILFIFLFMFIILIQSASGISECKSKMYSREVPCIITLPNNISMNDCSTINITFYNNNTFLSSGFMSNYNLMMCNYNFTNSNIEVYGITYGTGDTGTISIVEDYDNTYYLYIIAFSLAIVLLSVGYYLEDNAPIVLSGFVFIAIGISLYAFGFPYLTNSFLVNGISSVVLGVGMFFSVSPLINYFEVAFK